jgi:thioredoxin-related protein
MPAPADERPVPAGSTRGLPAWLLIAAAALLVLRVVATIVASRSPGGPAERVSWVPIPDAEGLARQSGRLILYDFSAEWCGPCREMSREVFADAAAAQGLEKKFVMVRVLDRQREEGRNAPDVAALQARFKVEAFPTLVIDDANGIALDRVEGYMGRQGLMARLGQSAFKISVSHPPSTTPATPGH